MSALRYHRSDGTPILVDLGPQSPGLLPGWHPHTATGLGSIPGRLVRGDERPARAETVGVGIPRYGQRGPSAAEHRADAAYRARHLDEIRAKDRARKKARES